MQEQLPSIKLFCIKQVELRPDEYLLVHAVPNENALLTSKQPLPALPAGTLLKSSAAVLQVHCSLLLHGTHKSLMLTAPTSQTLTSGMASYNASRPGLAIAVIILSDKGSHGLREDKCAPLIKKTVEACLPVTYYRHFLIPDDPYTLKPLLTDLSLIQKYDIIFTSGGTGVGPRDITPETTLTVLERRLQGYEQAMMTASLAKTPYGVISRAVAGTTGQSLIINLPGSPKAVEENLQPLLPALLHTTKKLQGDTKDCAVL